MKGLFRWLAREYVLVGIMMAGIMTLSLLPMFLKMLDAPPGRGFIPVHNSLSDYPFYTSIIAQGLDGQQTVWGRFTTEPQTKGAIVHYLYLVAGQAGRIFRITDAHIVYHALRTILGGIWIVTVYFFISKFCRTRVSRLTAFFFALFSAGWPIFADYGNGKVLWWPMNWWTELDPVQRAAFLPHYLIGHIFLVFSVIAVIRLVKNPPDKIAGWGLPLLTFLTMFIHPPSMILPLMVGPAWYLVTGRYRSVLRLVPAYLAAFAAIVIVRAQYNTFPWTMWLSYERMSFALTTGEYLAALGPVFVLGVAGFIIRRQDKIFWLLMLWVGLSVVMLEIVRWFPYSPFPVVRELTIGNIRFLQVAVWVPLAIGTGVFAQFLKDKYGTGILAVTLAVLATLTFAGYPQSVRFQREKIYGAPEFQFPSPGFTEAVMSLRELVKPEEAIWALPLAGQIIPSYINRTVYTGNQVYYTKDLSRKTDNSWGLYHGTNDACFYYREMKDNRIRAVFYGFDEQHAAGDRTGNGDALRKYPFLMPWKKFGDTSVFLFVDAKPEGCEG